MQAAPPPAGMSPATPGPAGAARPAKPVPGAWQSSLFIISIFPWCPWPHAGPSTVWVPLVGTTLWPATSTFSPRVVVGISTNPWAVKEESQCLLCDPAVLREEKESDSSPGREDSRDRRSRANEAAETSSSGRFQVASSFPLELKGMGQELCLLSPISQNSLLGSSLSLPDPLPQV